MQLSTVRALVTGGASGLGEGTVRAIVAAGGMATIIDLATSKGAQLAAVNETMGEMLWTLRLCTATILT